jgi:rod shape-determining protein MreD
VVRWFRFLLVAVAGVLLQTTLVRLLTFRGARPDLLVAMLAVFSLGVSPAEGFVVGLVLGLGRDLFSVEPLGLSTGLFAVLGCAVAWRRRGGSARHFLAHALFGFLCSVASSLASVLALVAQSAAPPVPLAVGRMALVGAGTAVLSGLVGALVRRRARWFGLRRRAEFGHV